MFSLLARWLVLSCCVITGSEHRQDHYEVLGIARNASLTDIKKAYRAKVLLHHPDKVPAAEKERANVRFRNIVQAYEVLSDAEARRRFDNTGPGLSTEAHDEPGPMDWWCLWFGECGGSSRKWEEERKKMVPLNVERAQLRMVKISSLQHLRDIALDEGGFLERGLLLAIVNVSDHICMRALQNDYLFPYPFAGWSKAEWDGGFWWEDVLQTYVVQYSDESHNDILEFFNVSPGKCPVIIFAEGGKTLESFSNFELTPAQKFVGTRPSLAFEHFMWAHLKTRLIVTNQHKEQVQILECKAMKCKPFQVVNPEQNFSTDTFISHDYIVREMDTQGYSLTHNSTLARLLIVNWTNNTFAISSRCVDKHSDCQQWSKAGMCLNADIIRSKQCKRSCGQCDEEIGRLQCDNERQADG